MSSIPMLKKVTQLSGGADSSVMQLIRTQLVPRWRAMSPRERVVVTLALLFMGVTLAWMLLIAPPLKALRSFPPQRAELDAQYQVMQRQAAEAQQLRAQPPVPPGQAEAALKAATEQLGSVAKLSITADRATVSLEGAGAAALSAWLTEVRTAARARVIEAQLSLKDKGYSGTVVLTLQRP